VAALQNQVIEHRATEQARQVESCMLAEVIERLHFLS
jgi:hypothetical protein